MRRITLFISLATLAIVGTVTAQQPRYRETVEVSRVLIDARVVGRTGNPLVGLGVADFAVKIDGKPARIESVQWIGGPDEAIGPPGSTEPRGTAASSPRGRLVVVLVQKDLERSRITGLMRLLVETPTFLETFSPEDRLAVLSFDSHLKVWLDFTNDLGRVRSVLQRSMRPGALNESAFPSLVERLPRKRAHKTYSIEEALRVIAEALEPLRGSKVIVLFGYGFGRLVMGRHSAFSSVMMEAKYDDARQAARASVFCLDITDADYHSLEVGLQNVAEETGGFFERTHIFTRRALDRLAGALASHYVLFVEKPSLRSGTHRIEVKLVNREGSVFAKSGFVD